MTIKNQKYTIATLVNVKDVQEILAKLIKAGLSEEEISVTVKEPKEKLSTSSTHTQKDYGNYAGAGTISGAVNGSILGSLLGVLVATGLVAIPLIGPIMLPEAILTVLATALVGSGMGITSGGIFGYLVGRGISKQPFDITDLKQSQNTYLIIIQGDELDIESAKKILNEHNQKWIVAKRKGLDSVPTLQES